MLFKAQCHYKIMENIIPLSGNLEEARGKRLGQHRENR